MTRQAPAWTHEEGLNFENGRALITDLMSIINVERSTEKDPIKIRNLNKRHQALSEERASLHVGNQEHIADVIYKYGNEVRTYFDALHPNVD